MLTALKGSQFYFLLKRTVYRTLDWESPKNGDNSFIYDLLDQILREKGFVSHECIFVTYLIQSFKC